MSDKIVQLNEGVCPRNNGGAKRSGEYDGKRTGRCGGRSMKESRWTNVHRPSFGK